MRLVRQRDELKQVTKLAEDSLKQCLQRTYAATQRTHLPPSEWQLV